MTNNTLWPRVIAIMETDLAATAIDVVVLFSVAIGLMMLTNNPWIVFGGVIVAIIYDFLLRISGYLQGMRDLNRDLSQDLDDIQEMLDTADEGMAETLRKAREQRDQG